MCLQFIKQRKTAKWNVHLPLLIEFYNSCLYILFQAKKNTKTEIPEMYMVTDQRSLKKHPHLQCQKPKFYFPLEFPVFSFWKSTCKCHVGRELLNNICQFWNFKEVVKNPHNSKRAERKLWDVALSKQELPTPCHSINPYAATRKTDSYRCRYKPASSLLGDWQEVLLSTSPQLHRNS